MSKGKKIDPEFRREFIKGFTGKDVGLNNPKKGQDSSRSAREARRKIRQAEAARNK